MIERFGENKIRLVQCPACHADLRGEHVAYHVERHSPADFGLTPEGRIR